MQPKYYLTSVDEYDAPRDPLDHQIVDSPERRTWRLVKAPTALCAAEAAVKHHPNGWAGVAPSGPPHPPPVNVRVLAGLSEDHREMHFVVEAKVELAFTARQVPPQPFPRGQFMGCPDVYATLCW